MRAIKRTYRTKGGSLIIVRAKPSEPVQQYGEWVGTTDVTFNLLGAPIRLNVVSSPEEIHKIFRKNYTLVE